MDIHVRIIRHTEANGDIWHSSKLTIGRTDLKLGESSEEVFWCAAAGKELPACISAVKARALLFAEREGIRSIYGLLIPKAGPCDPCLDPPSEVNILIPVTYNDWFTESPL